nr:AMP-binding protein [Bacillus subtilis]
MVRLYLIRLSTYLIQNWNISTTGVTGEIYIGGVGLAKGYFCNPELTQEKFIDSPHFGRLYKTGDIGRYLNNGEIEILGRRDMQVKIGGHRVELGEIERCIESLPNVNQYHYNCYSW